MATATFSHVAAEFIISPTPYPNHHHRSSSSLPFPFLTTCFCKTPLPNPPPKIRALRRPHRASFVTFSGSGGGGTGGVSGFGGGGGGGGGGGDSDGDAGERNRAEAIMALAEAGRALDSIPKDLAAAIEVGRIPGSIVHRFLELEKSPLLGWLLRFGGFKERLLADDLFLTKVAIECGVGIFTKTAAELERRREKFTKELDFVFADVDYVGHETFITCRIGSQIVIRTIGTLFINLAPRPFVALTNVDPFVLSHEELDWVMAIIADFMLVWLPAPTVSLRPPLAMNAGGLSKFFYGCPDNAFQVALAGTSYSLLQRIGAIVRNGAKLFAVGTGASLVGTGVTNLLITARKAVDKSFAGEAEDVPVLSTSVAYGVYMAVSSNLRYQILAGIIEQRILEPLLHEQKLILSAICFAVRTGNTFLGSLMWVDYARWIGVQKIRE